MPAQNAAAGAAAADPTAQQGAAGAIHPDGLHVAGKGAGADGVIVCQPQPQARDGMYAWTPQSGALGNLTQGLAAQHPMAALAIRECCRCLPAA